MWCLRIVVKTKVEKNSVSCILIILKQHLQHVAWNQPCFLLTQQFITLCKTDLSSELTAPLVCASFRFLSALFLSLTSWKWNTGWCYLLRASLPTITTWRQSWNRSCARRSLLWESKSGKCLIKANEQGRTLSMVLLWSCDRFTNLRANDYRRTFFTEALEIKCLFVTELQDIIIIR